MTSKPVTGIKINADGKIKLDQLFAKPNIGDDAVVVRQGAR